MRVGHRRCVGSATLSRAVWGDFCAGRQRSLVSGVAHGTEVASSNLAAPTRQAGPFGSVSKGY